MVNEQVVKDTIARMLEAEIDDDTIVSTLKDIGLDEEKSRQMLSQIKSSSNSENDSSLSDSSDESNVEDDDELNDLKNVKAELETQSQVRDLHDATTHNMLNDQYDRIDEISRKVDDVKKTVYDSTSRINIDDHSKKIDSATTSVAELNAKIDALSSLMKQILDVNRKILTEIEMKK